MERSLAHRGARVCCTNTRSNMELAETTSAFGIGSDEMIAAPGTLVHLPAGTTHWCHSTADASDARNALCATSLPGPRNNKAHPLLGGWALGIGAWRCPTLAWGGPTLPSAMTRFTAEFGMGSGGSTSLWSPGNWFALRQVGRRVIAGVVGISDAVFAACRRRSFGLYGQAARAISTG